MPEETATTKVSSALSKKKGKKSHFYTAIAVLGFLFLLAAGVAGYFYYQFKNIDGQKATNEITDILNIIGKVMELPEGEAPTLATVTDKEKLSDQPFFQKAENGDKILIYTNGGRAILYRPSTKKVVDMVTVNVKKNESEVPTEAQTPEAPAVVAEAAAADGAATPAIQATVALYNGSAKVGVTNVLEGEIETTFGNADVVAKEKAAKNDYQGNLVIDLSGKNAELAKKLAESFGGTVGTLPEGETAPTADILIIVGNK